MIHLSHDEVLSMIKGEAYKTRNTFDLLDLLDTAMELVKKIQEDLSYLHDFLALIGFKIADRYNNERFVRIEEYKKWQNVKTPEGVVQKEAALKECTRIAPLVYANETGRIDLPWDFVDLFTEERRPNTARRAGIKSVPAKDPRKQYSSCHRPLRHNKNGDYSLHMFRKETGSWVHAAGVEVELCLRQLRRARGALTAQKRNAHSVQIRISNVLNELNY